MIIIILIILLFLYNSVIEPFVHYNIETDTHDIPLGPINNCHMYLPVRCTQQTKDYYTLLTESRGKSNFKLYCYKKM